MRFRLPTLPFGHSDLEPFLSAETIDTHYFAHHKGYVDKTNELLSELGMSGVSLEKIILNHEGKLFDNAAQAWNHTFYWLGLTPKPGGAPGEGDFAEAIEKSFGDTRAMKKAFMEKASSIFGSGYTWLVAHGSNRLEFMNTHNADNPIRYENVRPLWTCDVWEHAYYIDYRNVRKEYLEGAWSHLNWEFVETCFRHQRFPNMSRLMMEDSPDAGISSAWM